MSFFDQAIETAPRERLEALQFEKLQTLLCGISGRNRFYTKKWKDAGVGAADIRLFSDLPKLPFTHKSDLVRAQEEAPPFGTNATFSMDAYSRVHQTSGTTGTPLRVVDTPESWEWSRVSGIFLRPFHRLLGGRRRNKKSRRDGDSRRRLGFPPALARDAGPWGDGGVLHPNVCVTARRGCSRGTLRHAILAGSHADPRRRAGSKRGADKIAH
jgi:hypothetical protein